MRTWHRLGLTVLALTATPVFAHPGHSSGHGFPIGIAHPLTGVDHILAMVAVGLLAAKLGGRAVWALPLAFVSLMLVGGALSFGHAPVPFVEQGIMASVVVLGVCVALAGRLSMPIALLIVGVFAAFHGYAHVAEMQSGTSALAYAAGFVVATSLLHAVGLALGFASRRPALYRVAGVGIACCGVLLFAHVI